MRSLVGLFETVGLALDGEDFGMMNEPVDEGDDASGVREDLAPFGERPIGCYQGALLLIAARDELEQQIGMAV